MGFLDDLFGTGDDNYSKDKDKKIGGDDNWTAPVHATTSDGSPVTVSFGRDGRRQEGQTLIASGHVSAKEFYQTDSSGRSVGHDHANGRGDCTDRGAYTGR